MPRTGGEISGVVGHLKWRDYTAAAINGYRVIQARDGTWSLIATVVLSDAYKMAQRPLTFVAKHKTGAWKWPLRTPPTIHPTTKQLTAQLGPPEP